MKVLITGDHAGMTLRNEVEDLLNEMGIEFDAGADCSPSVDYPDYALPAERVANGEFDRNFLFVEQELACLSQPIR